MIYSNSPQMNFILTYMLYWMCCFKSVRYSRCLNCGSQYQLNMIWLSIARLKVIYSHKKQITSALFCWVLFGNQQLQGSGHGPRDTISIELWMDNLDQPTHEKYKLGSHFSGPTICMLNSKWCTMDSMGITHPAYGELRIAPIGFEKWAAILNLWGRNNSTGKIGKLYHPLKWLSI